MTASSGKATRSALAFLASARQAAASREDWMDRTALPVRDPWTPGEAPALVDPREVLLQLRSELKREFLARQGRRETDLIAINVDGALQLVILLLALEWILLPAPRDRAAVSPLLLHDRDRQLAAGKLADELACVHTRKLVRVQPDFHGQHITGNRPGKRRRRAVHIQQPRQRIAFHFAGEGEGLVAARKRAAKLAAILLDDDRKSRPCEFPHPRGGGNSNGAGGGRGAGSGRRAG